MTRLILSIKTVAGAVLFVMAACVVGPTIEKHSVYLTPVVTFNDTNSVTPVQYTAMQDAKGE
jgi:hypothetical protein